MKRFFAKTLAFFGVAMLFATNASAAITLPASVPVADVETWAGAILVGLTLIWGVRKLIAMTNKS
jgi:hypothetical protein